MTDYADIDFTSRLGGITQVGEQDPLCSLHPKGGCPPVPAHRVVWPSGTDGLRLRKAYECLVDSGRITWKGSRAIALVLKVSHNKIWWLLEGLERLGLVCFDRGLPGLADGVYQACSVWIPPCSNQVQTEDQEQIEIGFLDQEYGGFTRARESIYAHARVGPPAKPRLSSSFAPGGNTPTPADVGMAYDPLDDDPRWTAPLLPDGSPNRWNGWGPDQDRWRVHQLGATGWKICCESVQRGHPWFTQTDMRAWTGLCRATVSRGLAKMVKAKAVERDDSGPRPRWRVTAHPELPKARYDELVALANTGNVLFEIALLQVRAPQDKITQAYRQRFIEHKQRWRKLRKATYWEQRGEEMGQAIEALTRPAQVPVSQWKKLVFESALGARHSPYQLMVKIFWRLKAFGVDLKHPRSTVEALNFLDAYATAA